MSRIANRKLGRFYVGASLRIHDEPLGSFSADLGFARTVARPIHCEGARESAGSVADTHRLRKLRRAAERNRTLRHLLTRGVGRTVRSQPQSTDLVADAPEAFAFAKHRHDIKNGRRCRSSCNCGTQRLCNVAELHSRSLCKAPNCVLGCGRVPGLQFCKLLIELPQHSAGIRIQYGRSFDPGRSGRSANMKRIRRPDRPVSLPALSAPAWPQAPGCVCAE